MSGSTLSSDGLLRLSLRAVRVGNVSSTVFSAPIVAVRARIAEIVGQVTCPRSSTWHPTIDRLLKEDEKRREKQSGQTQTRARRRRRFPRFVFSKRSMPLLLVRKWNM